MLTLLCIVLGVLIVVGAWPLASRWRASHGGQMYAGLAPGMTPPPGGPAEVRPVSEAELKNTTYAVQFHPPEGVEPRDVGLLLDRLTGPRDLAATIIQLTVQGYLTLAKDEENDDWLITVNRHPAGEPPNPSLWLLDYFDAGGGPVLLSQVKPGLRDAFARLEGEVLHSAHERGYIDGDPRGRRAPTGGLVMALILVLVVSGGLALAANPLAWIGAGAAGALGITAARVRGPVGRPAAGTAAYFRTMGFRQYLLTAEANQIKVEDAAGIFSRYLPWAIAFDAAGHWTEVFKDVAAGVDDDIADMWAPDLLWLAFMPDLMFGAGALLGGLDGALTDLTDTLGDFTGDLFGDLGDFGDMGDLGGLGDLGGDGGFFGGDGGGIFGGGDGGGFDFDF